MIWGPRSTGLYVGLLTALAHRYTFQLHPVNFCMALGRIPTALPFRHTPTPGRGFIANSSNCHNSPKLSKISGWQARFCARFLLRWPFLFGHPQFESEYEIN